MKEGEAVVVHGLISKPEYNGLPGYVESIPPSTQATPERVAVSININTKGSSRKKTLAVKNTNLIRSCLLRSGNQRRRAINTHKLSLLWQGLVDTLMNVLRDWELLLRIANFLPDKIVQVIFSGYRGGCVDTVYAFQPAGNRKWWEPTTMTPSRIDCAVILYARGTKALFAGGVDDHPRRGNVTSTACVYDSLTSQWSELPPMSTSRHGCAGTEANGKLYICGGLYRNAECDTDTVECYDPANPDKKWTSLPTKAKSTRTLPSQIFPACGTLTSPEHGLMVVMAGGESTTPTGSCVSSNTFGFAIGKEEWIGLPHMETARSATAFTVVKCSWSSSGGSASSSSSAVDVLVVAGGRGKGGESLRSVEMFDGMEWKPLPDLLVPRLGGTLVALHGTVYAVGGATGMDAYTDDPFTKMVEKLVPNASCWIECPEMEMPIAYHACAGLAMTQIV